MNSNPKEKRESVLTGMPTPAVNEDKAKQDDSLNKADRRIIAKLCESLQMRDGSVYSLVKPLAY